MRLAILSLIALLSLGGCYNPDLGDSPYLCGANMTCPSGYMCHEFPENPEKFKWVCLKDIPPDVGIPDRRILSDAELVPSKEGPVYLDNSFVMNPGPNNCIDASNEPNNSGATATPIFSKGVISDWEICYKYDVDQYAFKLDAGDALKVTVQFTHSKGDLDAALVDPNGKVISSSRSETNNETVEVLAADTVKGHYILGVWGIPNKDNWEGTNKYSLNIVR